MGTARPRCEKAALYLRVSTREQTTENQELELRRWAERLGLEVVRVYTETASGARADRAALAAVLAGAHAREFDALLVWSLDRLTREGIAPMLRYLEQLRSVGVRVVSLKEAWVDSASPTWDLLVAVFAWVAKQERERNGERIRAGLARARAQGVRLGRKPWLVDVVELQRRRAAGQGWRRIARALKVPVSTLREHWKPCGKPPSELTHAPGAISGSSAGSQHGPVGGTTT